LGFALTSCQHPVDVWSLLRAKATAVKNLLPIFSVSIHAWKEKKPKEKQMRPIQRERAQSPMGTRVK